jgi:hypothetical protein
MRGERVDSVRSPRDDPDRDETIVFAVDDRAIRFVHQNRPGTTPLETQLDRVRHGRHPDGVPNDLGR